MFSATFGIGVPGPDRVVMVFREDLVGVYA